MSNYAFVVDSSYKPFSLQEMLVPFTAYKEEFEKAETAYTDLTDKADTFKYLSEKLPEGSKARQLYEGYANNLKSQAEDLAHNGLTRANRTALTSLKRRYQGEIGRVAKADEAMEAEKKLRQSLNAQDSSRLYAMDNLSVDDFLDGNNPNLYNISGNELYTRGAAAGKAASSRVYNFGEGNITLGGYYRDVVSKVGYGPQAIAKFREDISSNPELAAAVDSILAERGVTQNLTGVNLERARQSVINGIIDGAVYQENHNPQRDLGVIDAATQAQLDLSKENRDIELQTKGLTYNPKTHEVTYNIDKDPEIAKAKAIAEAKAKAKNEAKTSGGSKTGGNSDYQTQSKEKIRVEWNTPGDPNDGTKMDKPNDVTITKISDDDADGKKRLGDIFEYDELPQFVKDKIDKVVKNGDYDMYDYYYRPFTSHFFSNDNATLEIIPRDIQKYNTEEDDDSSLSLH